MVVAVVEEVEVEDLASVVVAVVEEVEVELVVAEEVAVVEVEVEEDYQFLHFHQFHYDNHYQHRLRRPH